VATVSTTSDKQRSTDDVGSEYQQDSAIQHPTSLKAVVPSTTDQGISETPTETEGNSSYQSETTAQPITPSSPSKSTSFFGRILGGLLPSTTPSTAETTAASNVSALPPSASWGREPFEQVRQAGTVRADETGLDEPTATKQAGLGASSGGSAYQRSSPTTAVAAAESLADTKADAQHDTAAASQYTPRSPGHAPLCAYLLC